MTKLLYVKDCHGAEGERLYLRAPEVPDTEFEATRPGRRKECHETSSSWFRFPTVAGRELQILLWVVPSSQAAAVRKHGSVMTRKAHFNARVYRSSTSDVRGDIVETPWGVWVAAWSRLSFVTVKTGRGVELAAFRPTDSSKALSFASPSVGKPLF